MTESGNVKVLTEDSQFQLELTSAGTKLVVADFFATWCGPCQRISPAFIEYSSKYPKAVFIKIDVDLCPQTAQENGISAMPTFVFLRNKIKIDTLKGSNPAALEEKIKQWYSEEEGEEEEPAVKGHMDLSTFITKSGCECLNSTDENTLEHALTLGEGHLESDVDEQLIINIAFNQPVKIHSMKINAPEDKGPKSVKLFINQPTTLDFDTALSSDGVQLLELKTEDLKEGSIIPLKYVKFQNVQNVTIFVKDNQGGTEKTEINYLGLIGSPVGATNMAEFKRVAGKKGESH